MVPIDAANGLAYVKQHRIETLHLHYHVMSTARLS